MEKFTPPSSAITLDRETIDLVLERSRKIALQQAGETQAKVSTIGSIQRDAYRELLAQAEGADGASMQETVLSDDTQAEIESRIQSEEQERMTAIAAAPDAYVFRRTDATVGVQHDDDRRIGLADQALEDPALLKRVSEHEAAHRRQEVGDQTAALPQTGDATIDRDGALRRLTFRENDSIAAEGGLNGHTNEYEGFVKTSDAVAAYLDRHGEDGQALVTEAGRTDEGFAKMHQKVLAAAVREKMQEQLKQTVPVLAS